MLEFGKGGIMAYSALDAARYIIWNGYENMHLVSNLRLQKLLYFVQANFLVEAGKPCFDDEIEAWGLGPVVPAVYHQYKKFGSSIIQGRDWKNGGALVSDCDKPLIDEIVEYLLDYSTSQLVKITHARSPWKNVYVPRMNNIISKQSIKKFFTEAGR